MFSYTWWLNNLVIWILNIIKRWYVLDRILTVEIPSPSVKCSNELIPYRKLFILIKESDLHKLIFTFLMMYSLNLFFKSCLSLKKNPHSFAGTINFLLISQDIKTFFFFMWARCVLVWGLVKCFTYVQLPVYILNISWNIGIEDNYETGFANFYYDYIQNGFSPLQTHS